MPREKPGGFKLFIVFVSRCRRRREIDISLGTSNMTHDDGGWPTAIRGYREKVTYLNVRRDAQQQTGHANHAKKKEKRRQEFTANRVILQGLSREISLEGPSPKEGIYQPNNKLVRGSQITQAPNSGLRVFSLSFSRRAMHNRAEDMRPQSFSNENDHACKQAP